ncbi:hypothetical protein [Moraxella lacunata]|uniref:hypothetical protein n=1 Tax=Moraxella lacunata TaxID=477 RepID=UPI003EE13B6B
MPTVHRAVLPATCPLRATDFLGLKPSTLGSAFSVIAMFPFVLNGSNDNLLLNYRYFG